MIESAEVSVQVGGVDIVATICKLLTLMASLQASGLAIFAVLYGRLVAPVASAITRLAAISSLVGAILSLLLPFINAARMSGDVSGAFDLTLLQLAWLSATGVTAVTRSLGLLLIWRGAVRNRRNAVVLGIAMTVLSFALSGHSLSYGPPMFMSVLLFIHVAVAAYWFGSLPALSIVAKHTEPSAVIDRFSKHATSLVPILALLGVGMAAFLLPNMAALATPYGLSVAMKANGFVLLFLIAAYNKFRLSPAIQRNETRAIRMFRYSVMLEYAVMAAVLAATSMMTTLFAPD